MTEIKEMNAVITSTTITTDEHGCLGCWLHLDYGGSGQGFGAWALYLPKSFTHHKLLSHVGHFIYRVMEVAGVDKWDQLPGKTIRVRAEHSQVHAIGHIVKDIWFEPSKEFKEAHHVAG